MKCFLNLLTAKKQKYEIAYMSLNCIIFTTSGIFGDLLIKNPLCNLLITFFGGGGGDHMDAVEVSKTHQNCVYQM